MRLEQLDKLQELLNRLTSSFRETRMTNVRLSRENEKLKEELKIYKNNENSSIKSDDLINLMEENKKLKVKNQEAFRHIEELIKKIQSN